MLGLASVSPSSWRSSDVQCFGPLAFLDVPGAEEAAPGQSLQNSGEAEMALHLFSGLLERYPELRKHPGRIGIMSPYRGQVCCQTCGRS